MSVLAHGNLIYRCKYRMMESDIEDLASKRRGFGILTALTGLGLEQAPGLNIKVRQLEVAFERLSFLKATGH